MKRTTPSPKSVLVAGVMLALIVPLTSIPLSSARAEQSVSFPRSLDFWPKRLNPDATSLLYVQLAAVEKQPVARLECGTADYELGPATWSHNLGYVHAFDLEFSAPRTRANCVLRVTGRKGKEYVGHRPLALRKRVAQMRVSSLAPDVVFAGQEIPVDVRGVGFGDIVNVVWVATDRDESYSRTVRAEEAPRGRGAVVPFVPGTTGAGAGDYLVVVENEDRAAAVYSDHFAVEDEPEPEVVRSSLARHEGKTWIAIEGFGLSGLQDARLVVVDGTQNLHIERVEGMALETLRVQLPAHAVDSLAYTPELLFEARQLTVRLVRCSRLTQCNSELPPSRD